ncbi:MAG TPA: hypothetical protein VN723_09045 [Rhizomicrobium sp.]|jgi:hypothetical protein|nr:hypothetical protein [Rhizomicrobium sp.]
MTEAEDPVARLKARIKERGWGTAVDETLSFNQPELRSLLEVWRAKADALDDLPRREDLDMRLLKPFLRHLSVSERVDLGGRSSYRLRLQGSTMADYFGSQTGKLLEEAAPPELAERWIACYDALLEARRPLRLVGTYDKGKLDYLVAETLAVPLGNGDAPPNSILAATYYTPRHKGRD